jgi:hypothetical protein
VIRGEMIGFTGVVKIEMMGVIKKNGWYLKLSIEIHIHEVRCWYLGTGIQENLDRRSTPTCFHWKSCTYGMYGDFSLKEASQSILSEISMYRALESCWNRSEGQNYKCRLKIIHLWCVWWFWFFRVPKNHPETRIRYGGR